MSSLSDSTVTIHDSLIINPNYISDKLPVETQLEHYKKMCSILQNQLKALESRAQKPGSIKNTMTHQGLTEKELNKLIKDVMQMAVDEIAHSPDLKKKLGISLKADEKLDIETLKKRLYEIYEKEKIPSGFADSDLTKSYVWVQIYTKQIEPTISDLERIESMKDDDVNLNALSVFKEVVEILADPDGANKTKWTTRIATILSYSNKGLYFAYQHYYLIPLLMPYLTKTGLAAKIMSLLISVIGRRLLLHP